MPAGASPKRERQYRHIKASAKKSGRYGGRAEEVAARTVNKIRREKGETKSQRGKKSRSSSSRSRSTRSKSTRSTRKRTRSLARRTSARRTSTTRGRSRSGRRGFAGMSAARQRAIAAEGGRAAHQQGTAHEFSSSEAQQAGHKGGKAVSRDRSHMSAIGRRGGER